MAGATLDNSTSTTASTVMVDNGIFQDNEGNGLYISSVGGVALSNIIADRNDVGGVSINNSTAAIDQAVTLSGTQQYNNNGNGNGLTVISRGFVMINNVVANANGGDGVHIDNRASLSSQGVTVGGTNTFNDNGNGLYVRSRGVITVSNLSASRNDDDGVRLDNCDEGGSGCTAASAPAVNVTGDNYFNYNSGNGLYVTSYGSITTNNLSASCNGYVNDIGVTYCSTPAVPAGSGAVLQNQWHSDPAFGDIESAGTHNLERH